MISNELAQKVLSGKVDLVFLYPDTDSGKRPGLDFEKQPIKLLASLRKVFPDLKVKGNGRLESYNVNFVGTKKGQRKRFIDIFRKSEVSIEDVDYVLSL